MTNHDGWRPIQLASLGLVIIVAAGLRLWNLGGPELAPDEVFHLFAASSVADTGSPLLPSGEVYDRGLITTYVVAGVFEVFGDSLVAARAGNAVISLLAVVVFAWVAWSMAGGWAAVWATLFLAVWPEAVFQGRYLRFYSMQLLVGMFALGAGWAALRRLAASDVRRRRVWVTLAIVVGLLTVAAWIQVAALSVALGFAISISLVAVRDVRRDGVASVRRNPAVQAVIAGLLVSLLALSIEPSLPGVIWERSQYVAAWARGGHVLEYYWGLKAPFPIIIGLVPALFVVVAARKSRWLAIHLFLWFAVPVVLHSLLFPWKGMRFVFVAVPALFVAAGVTAAAMVDALRTQLQSDQVLSRRPWAAFALVVSLAWVVGTQSGLHDSLDLISERRHTGLRAAASVIASSPKLRDAEVATDDHTLIALYYVGRLDYRIPREYSNGYALKEIQVRPDSTDLYTGVPVIFNTAQLPSARPAGLVMALTRGVAYPADIMGLAQSQGEVVCDDRCRPLVLYYLPPSGTTGSDSTDG